MDMGLKASVLVVDDEASVRRFVGRVLKSNGYHVSVAASGEEALTQLHSDPQAKKRK